GEYEIGTSGSLRALLELVGGVSQAGAASDARLTRVGADDRKETLTLDLRTALKAPEDVVLQPGDTLFVPTIAVLQDLVEVRGAFKAPGSHDFRTDLTPREYVALAGGPTNRARLTNTSVTFRNGRTFAMADAPPLEPGAVVTVPEVSVKWWQDYLTILSAIASL